MKTTLKRILIGISVLCLFVGSVPVYADEVSDEPVFEATEPVSETSKVEPITEVTEVSETVETSEETVVTDVTDITSEVTSVVTEVTKPDEATFEDSVHLFFCSAQLGKLTGVNVTVNSETQTIGDTACTWNCVFGAKWKHNDTVTVTLSNLPYDTLRVYVGDTAYSVSNGSVTFDVTGSFVSAEDSATGQPSVNTQAITLVSESNYIDFCVLGADSKPVSGATITGTFWEVVYLSDDETEKEYRQLTDEVTYTTGSDGFAQIICPVDKEIFFEYKLSHEDEFISSRTPYFKVSDSIYSYYDKMKHIGFVTEEDPSSNYDEVYKDVSVKMNYVNFDESLTTLYDCSVIFTDTQDSSKTYDVPLSFKGAKLKVPCGTYNVAYKSGASFNLSGPETFTVDGACDFKFDLSAKYVVEVHKLSNNTETSWSFTYNGNTYSGTGVRRFAVAKGLTYLLSTADGTVSLSSSNQTASLDLSTGAIKNSNADKVANAPKTGDFLKIFLGLLAACSAVLGGLFIYKKKFAKKSTEGCSSDDEATELNAEEVTEQEENNEDCLDDDYL